ncbi:hypothetical protein [Rhodoplanes sp. SY1]|uniref:hypothetical protein n=1 Tax=Rhodoplanes sp. SY1 TaxID=3166646 RepID=UPI0038B48721
MNELEQVFRLIERIYDASLDASLWPDVLHHACYFVQGCTANLFFQDIVTQKVVVFHSWGEDLHYRQLYFERYAPLNPLFPASSFLEVGTVHAVNDIMPLDEFRTSRLYQEWVQPQGILDVLYSNLERTATGAAALAIRRLERDRLFDDSAKARFALLVPHVRRAASIGKVIDFHRTNEVALSAALDRLTAAVLLVTSDARPVYLNAAELRIPDPACRVPRTARPTRAAAVARAASTVAVAVAKAASTATREAVAARAASTATREAVAARAASTVAAAAAVRAASMARAVVAAGAVVAAATAVVRAATVAARAAARAAAGAATGLASLSAGLPSRSANRVAGAAETPATFFRGHHRRHGVSRACGIVIGGHWPAPMRAACDRAALSMKDVWGEEHAANDVPPLQRAVTS